MYSSYLYLYRDGIRESHVVSKTFDVNQVEQDDVNTEEDSMGFMSDIPENYVSVVSNVRWFLLDSPNTILALRKDWRLKGFIAARQNTWSQKKKKKKNKKKNKKKRTDKFCIQAINK